MLTLFIALLMLFIGYHVGAAHLVERLSKRVYEDTELIEVSLGKTNGVSTPINRY